MTDKKPRRQRRPKYSGFVRTRGASRSLIVTIGGKQYSRAVTTKTLKEAQALLPAFVADVQSGKVATALEAAKAAATAPTFRELVAEFTRDHMRMDADGEATRRAYARWLAVAVAEFGELRLAEISRDALQRFLRRLHESGRETARADGSAGLSIASVRLARDLLSAFFRRMVKRKLLAESPLPSFTELNLGSAPRASERTRRSGLASGQVKALLRACAANDALRLWVEVMIATGGRPGEALGLRWRDVDATRGVLHIEHSVKRGSVHGQGRLGATKTPGSVRTIPLGAALAASLERERARQEAIQRQLSGLSDNVAPVRPLLDPDDCIFAANPDELRRSPRSLSGMRKAFKAACRTAALPSNTVPHQLRHTAITAMIAGNATRPGVSVVEAAALAGHSDPGMVSRVYAHAVQANLKRGADLADDLLAPVPEVEVERLPNVGDGSSDR